MPVVFRDGGLRYFFYSNEGLPREPRHIHVKGGGKDAKIWRSRRWPWPWPTAMASIPPNWRYSTHRLGAPGPDSEGMA